MKLMNNSNLSLPDVIDGVTGSHNIVNMRNINCCSMFISYFTHSCAYFKEY